jgi:nucleoside-diphosphate-sugar epimerase
MATALVTGATGFIGSHLSEELSNRGWEVTCLARRTSNLRWIGHKGLKIEYGSVGEDDSLDRLVAGKEYIFHCAGLTKARSEAEYDRVNAEGTRRLLAACERRNSGVKRVVCYSSQAAVGPSRDGKPLTEESECRPITAYGRSKLKGEVYTREYMGRLPIAIIRPTAVYGPRDRDVYAFFKMVDKGLVFLTRDPRTSYVNLVYVADVVKAGILAAERDEAVGQTYFATHPKALSWSEGIAAMSEALAKRCRVVRLPYGVMRIAGLVGEVVGKMQGKAALVNRDKVKEINQRYWLCSTEKIERELGYRADYGAEEGAKITAQWYRREGWL